MAERSGRANSVRSRMCGRDGVAGDVIITSRRGCMGSKKQAVAAKGEWSTGSSGSSGEEEREARSLEAENKELG